MKKFFEKWLFLILVMALFTLIDTQNIFADNLVVNGSFETPTAPNGIYLDHCIPDSWNGLGNGSSVDIISAGYRGSTASEGNQFVDLIAGSSPPLPSGIFQTIHLDGSETYYLSFDYNGSLYDDGSHTSGAVLEYFLGTFLSGAINVDALNVYSYNGPTTPWQREAVYFTVPTTGDYDLKFQTPSGLWASPFIDNIQLMPVPEPSTFALLSMSAFSLLTWACRRCNRAA
jgi:hypothetical protein